jgi:Protein of unknown function (DUF3592)
LLKFWIGLVIGLLCLIIWSGNRTEAAATAKWPSVPGVITDMKITESHSSDGSISKTAALNYAYSVDGKSYQGDRVRVELATSPSDAERYPKGTQVTVFYNPATPGDSVLEQGGAGSWLTGLIGLGCLVYAGYALVERRRRTKLTPAVAEAGGIA